MKSWHKKCPDYVIKRWDESTFSFGGCPQYVLDALAMKKWAFVSDYVRLWILFREGGIYMDTDVEVVRSLDPFLHHEAFSGFEDHTRIPTAIMGSVSGQALIKKLLDDYNDKQFVLPDGSINTTTNVTLITQYLSAMGFVPNNKLQTIGGMALYPNDVFCPKEYGTGIIRRTKRTTTIHHFSSSWHDPKEARKRRRLQALHHFFYMMFGPRYLSIVSPIKRWVMGKKG